MARCFSRLLASIALGVTQLVCLNTSYAGQADDNSQAMERAARSLKFESPVDAPANKAYMLEKAASASEVAVIFGYADNEAACKQIALVLTESLNAGPFQCHPIY